MFKIDRFENFGKVLYIFDFDDTLVKSPSFEDIAKTYIKENVKDSFFKILKSINKSTSDLNLENGRLFINDLNNELPENKNWKRKGNRLYLLSPDNFCFMAESLPTKTKDIILELFNKEDNSCIVTARPESMRTKIEEVMLRLKIKFPKFGLHMCPNSRIDAGIWKGEKIVELCQKHNFSNAIFYDDNSKYIRKAKKVVKEKMPQLKFEAIKVI